MGCGLFPNQPLSENRYSCTYHCCTVLFTAVIYILYVDTFILFTPSVIFITFNIDNPNDIYICSDMDGTLSEVHVVFKEPRAEQLSFTRCIPGKNGMGIMLDMKHQCVTTNESY